MTTDKQRDDDGRLGAAALGLIPAGPSDAALIKAAAGVLGAEVQNLPEVPPRDRQVDRREWKRIFSNRGSSGRTAARRRRGRGPATGRPRRGSAEATTSYCGWRWRGWTWSRVWIAGQPDDSESKERAEYLDTAEYRSEPMQVTQRCA